MYKENNDHLHEDVKTVISSGGEKSHDPEKTLCEDVLYAAEDGWLYHDDILEDIILVPNQLSSHKAILYQLNVKRALLDRYLNKKVKDLLFVIIKKEIMEK